jgi:hypothetical protein
MRKNVKKNIFTKIKEKILQNLIAVYAPGSGTGSRNSN